MITGTEKRAIKPSCNVQVDNKKVSFSEFVAVGYNPETGQATVVNNADVILMAVALEAIKIAFTEAFEALPEEHKEIVKETLVGY